MTMAAREGKLKMKTNNLPCSLSYGQGLASKLWVCSRKTASARSRTLSLEGKG